MPRRSLAGTLALVCLAALLPRLAVAQATPPAAERAPATIYDADRQPIGTMRLTELVDPFTDVDPSAAPAPGTRWVMVVLAYAAGDAPLALDGRRVELVGDDGSVASSTDAVRPPASDAAVPAFDQVTLEPGASATGAVFFRVSDGVAPAFLQYHVAAGHISTVADLRPRPLPSIATVAYAGPDGPASLRIAVTGVIDAQTGADSPPDPGTRYVSFAIAVTNTGSAETRVDPAAFVVVDGRGALAASIDPPRSFDAMNAKPDLEYAPLAPGATVAGLVHFAVAEDAVLTAVLFIPDNGWQFRVADPTTPATAATPAASPAAPGCAAAVDLMRDINRLLAPVAPVLELVDLAATGDAVDPAALRTGADTLRAAAQAVAAEPATAVAPGLPGQFADALNAMADAIGPLADAVDQGDAAAAATAATNVRLAAFGLTGGAYTDLLIACPTAADA